MSFVLADLETAQSFYFSLVINEHIAASMNGHWTAERDDALQFARKSDAENFAKLYLRHLPKIEAKEV